MANAYISDAMLTARIAVDHADLNTEAERLAACIQPASRWVDSRYPYSGEFAAWADADTPDPVIQQAALAYAQSLAHVIMTNQFDNGQSVALRAEAKSLLRVDEATGEAHYDSSGSTDAVATGALTRDLDDEREALRDVVM